MTSCLVSFHITIYLFKVAAAFCASCVAGALSTNSELHYHTGKNEVYQTTVQVRNPYQFEFNLLENALCSAEHLRKSYFTEFLNVLWLMGLNQGWCSALASHQCGLGFIPARCHMWVGFVSGSRLTFFFPPKTSLNNPFLSCLTRTGAQPFI